MTTIDRAKNYGTLINVFAVAPEKSQELFGLLKEAAETVMSKLPGYVSANLHFSDDHKTVTTYAQRATLEDYQNVTKHEEALKHMKLAAATATGFTPVIYTNIWMHFNKG